MFFASWHWAQSLTSKCLNTSQDTSQGEPTKGPVNKWANMKTVMNDEFRIKLNHYRSYGVDVTKMMKYHIPYGKSVWFRNKVWAWSGVFCFSYFIIRVWS